MRTYTHPRPLAYTAAGVPIFPISGAEGGYHTGGDVLTRTLDGRPLNELWTEFNTTLDLINDQRNAVTNLLCARTVRSADEVAQTTKDSGFELASEFGEPTGARPEFTIIKVGFPFHDYDRATRFTWRYLRDAEAPQVEQTHRSVLAADNELTTHAILARLLSPVQRENEDGVPVYGLYNGDVQVPPQYQFRTFSGPHTHYLTTSSGEASGADLDDMARHITEHGYGTAPGSRLVLFCNPTDLDSIAGARSGDEFGARYDFISSSGAPAYLTTESLVGERPPGEYNNLELAGAYGRVWIAPTDFMPPGYLLMSATDGPDGQANPVGFREHSLPEWRGLRLVPGNAQGYPLVESFYTRGFGVGVRHRGAAVAMQITTNAEYAPPEQFAGVFL